MLLRRTTFPPSCALSLRESMPLERWLWSLDAAYQQQRTKLLPASASASTSLQLYGEDGSGKDSGTVAHRNVLVTPCL